MADSDYVEFSVAQGRKYTLEHLWLQVLDEKKSDSQVKIGLSEFVRAEFGDIIRVILTKPEDDSEFKIEDSDDDEGEVKETRAPLRGADELPPAVARGGQSRQRPRGQCVCAHRPCVSHFAQKAEKQAGVIVPNLTGPNPRQSGWEGPVGRSESH